MKNLTGLICLFALVTAAAFGAAPSIKLGGVTYLLVHVDVAAKDGAITNEYVPAGQTLENWTTLIGVRQWPALTKISDAAGPWLKMVEPLLAQKPGAYRPAGASSPDDVVLEAWLTAPDRSYVEINLHRFVSEPGAQGVKAYQFAQKIVVKDGNADPTTYVKNRDALFAELSKLKVPAHKQKR